MREGSSESLAASTHPAVPPPAIATSYVTRGEYGRAAYESPVRAVGGDHTYGVVVVTV